MFAREPSPSEAAILVDLVSQLMAGLPDEDRTVLMLHLQGYTIAEIKAQNGRAMRTVRRILERVRKHLRTLEGEKPNGNAN